MELKELEESPSQIEIAEAIRLSEPFVSNVIRRMAYQLDNLKLIADKYHGER